MARGRFDPPWFLAAAGAILTIVGGLAAAGVIVQDVPWWTMLAGPALAALGIAWLVLRRRARDRPMAGPGVRTAGRIILVAGGALMALASAGLEFAPDAPMGLLIGGVLAGLLLACAGLFLLDIAPPPAWTLGKDGPRSPILASAKRFAAQDDHEVVAGLKLRGATPRPATSEASTSVRGGTKAQAEEAGPKRWLATRKGMTGLGLALAGAAALVASYIHLARVLDGGGVPGVQESLMGLASLAALAAGLVLLVSAHGNAPRAAVVLYAGMLMAWTAPLVVAPVLGSKAGFIAAGLGFCVAVAGGYLGHVRPGTWGHARHGDWHERSAARARIALVLLAGLALGAITFFGSGLPAGLEPSEGSSSSSWTFYSPLGNSTAQAATPGTTQQVLDGAEAEVRTAPQRLPDHTARVVFRLQADEGAIVTLHAPDGSYPLTDGLVRTQAWAGQTWSFSIQESTFPAQGVAATVVAESYQAWERTCTLAGVSKLDANTLGPGKDCPGQVMDRPMS